MKLRNIFIQNTEFCRDDGAFVLDDAGGEAVAVFAAGDGVGALQARGEVAGVEGVAGGGGVHDVFDAFGGDVVAGVTRGVGRPCGAVFEDDFADARLL